ncbi:unnamed protein product [Arctia plantaginis]|uniref:MOG interacting and ectopic P-granules protein 1 n=1 Tax=Arctia plantaginis TaxID=874455 RepID=A0A8S0Z1Q0_ARCPL|nr:unnamed protein product [Arctia plantaginis]
MNGEVNGTMETSMDTSSSEAPDNVLSEKKVGLEGCEISTDPLDCNPTADSNHLHSEESNECETAKVAEHLENEHSNSSDNHKQSLEESTNVPEHVNSNNSFTENHYNNSNQSDAESMSSSQAKSETTDQQIMHNIDDKCMDEESEKEFEKNITHVAKTNNENSDNEVDSEEDSSDECSEVEPRAEDTVSINSDTDPETAEDSLQKNQMKIKNSDIIILENERPHSQNGNSHESPSPEIHEIVSDNDDCVMAEEEKVKTNNSDNKVQLRRSSRAIKRKRYTDEVVNGDNESDIEEIAMEAPFYRKSKPIVINDTKTLVEMAARQMKSHQSNQRKEPTVVIIDTNSIGTEKTTTHHKHSAPSTNLNLSAQSLYQSIVARGTTVTPISSKSNVSTQSSAAASQTPQPSILPSLTDDMFVVEAPSFIVPYVYEKPSVKPFREFVDTLGKELDEQKAKEDKEKERKDKEKKDAVKRDKEELNEEAEESMDVALDSSAEASAPSEKKADAESPTETEEKKKKKKEKKKRGDIDDDVSWDGETSTDTDDEILSDEEDKTIIIKDKVDAIDEIKDVTELTAEKVCSNKSDNYFDCSLGKFFINIGLSLVQEYVQSDLLKQQNRKLYREKKQGHNTKSTETSIASLMKNIEFSKENNAPYAFTQLKCEFCSFKTESKLVMSHHLETPHMKNNVYKCNFCPFEIRSPHDILYHMEAEHNIRGKLERAPAYHQCANCPFEDNGKGKLARHLIPCAKKFKPESNLAPPLEWEPPAKIPKIARSRNNMMGSYQNSFNRGQMGNNLGRPPMNVTSIMPTMSSYRPRGRSPMAVPPRAAPVHGAPLIRGGVMVRHNAPALMSSNYPVANNVKKSVHQPSISITPLPRQPQPVLPQPSHNSKSTFVICEICDGYIKDLEQLRNHMQWIHKVKIHPKMIYNRPPLNCQKCQFRFFTDQGLERHLLGSHGLVTSSMQEAANKGKDAGRCPVCGRVYQWKLLNHVARDHSLTLKPAHLSYKCTVCTATFGMYKQFENHVYSAHSVVAKRVMDKGKSTTSAKNSDSLLKPLKINDEITIIPQPVKTPAAAAKDD